MIGWNGGDVGGIPNFIFTIPEIRLVTSIIIYNIVSG